MATHSGEVLVRTQMELFNKQLKSGSGAQEGVSAEVQVQMVDTEKGCELSLGKPEVWKENKLRIGHRLEKKKEREEEMAEQKELRKRGRWFRCWGLWTEWSTQSQAQTSQVRRPQLNLSSGRSGRPTSQTVHLPRFWCAASAWVSSFRFCLLHDTPQGFKWCAWRHEVLDFPCTRHPGDSVFLDSPSLPGT